MLIRLVVNETIITDSVTKLRQKSNPLVGRQAHLLMFPANASGEFELNSPPKDGVSSVKFGNETDHLISSSWDSVRLVNLLPFSSLRGTI